MAELRELMTGGKSCFIIASVVSCGNGDKKRTRIRPARNDSARPYYRCKLIFDRLNDWLRSKGVKKPTSHCMKCERK